MIKQLFKFLILIMGMAISSFTYGQIQAPTADRVDSTAYINDSILGKDPIFVFYTPNKNGHDVGGDLIASFNDTIYADYTWFMDTTLSGNFIPVPQEDTSVNISTLNQTEFTEGVYRVHIVDTNNNIDTMWYAWLALNEFDLGFPIVDDRKTNCTNMGLITKLDFDETFDYYDLIETDSFLTVYNNIDSLYWTATETYTDPIPESQTPVFPAPTSPTKFTITVRDTFGYTVEKYIDITEDEPSEKGIYPWLRAVNADFHPSLFSDPESETLTVTDQAPLNVQFKNKSKNAKNYYWTFYNDDKRITLNQIDSIKYETELIRPDDSVLYDFPGEYAVKLLIEGPEYKQLGESMRCSDTMLIEKCVDVDTVFMPTLMNVFTPNNDNKNERFYFESYPGAESGGEFKAPRSIKEFSIKIYSRWGQKLHDFDGNIEDWEGWDGDTPGIGKAKTGVYYYHAIYTGYDNVFHGKETGFIHIYTE